MLETIGNLIRYIVVLIFVSTLLEMILPKGVFRRYLRLLIGILLILTLITPLQKIMRIAPYWEMPALTPGRAQEHSDELGMILGRGEQLYQEKMKSALADYQVQVFDLLEYELAREFKQKLLHLQVVAVDDPASREFGMLKKIYAVVQPQGAIPRVTASSDPAEIYVAVEVASPGREQGGERENAGGGEQASEGKNAGEKRGTDKPVEQLSPAAAGGENAAALERYLANYFRLSPEDVQVEIWP